MLKRRCVLFAAIPAKNTLPKRKSGLSSKACATKTVLPSFVAVWHYRTAWICVAQLCLLFQDDH